MKRTRKIVLFLILVSVSVLIIFFSLCNRFFFNNFEKIERIQIADEVKNTQLYIEDYKISLNRTNSSWSIWTDTYRFIQDLNQDYIYYNLSRNNFLNSNINYILFVNKDGKIVYAKGYDTQYGYETNVPLHLQEYVTGGSGITRFSSEDEAKSGFIYLDGAAIVISSIPVLKSDLTGPSDGTLVMARIISNDETEKISKLCGYTISLMQPNSINLNTRLAHFNQDGESIYYDVSDRKNIEAYITLDSPDNSLPVILHIEVPRTISILSREGKTLLFSTTAAMIFIFLMVLLFILNRYVFKLLNNQSVLLDTIPSSVFYKDKNLKYVMVNRSFYKNFNVKPGEIKGKTYFEISGDYFEAARMEDTDSLVKKSLKPLQNLNWYYTDRNGNTKWISESKSPILDMNGSFNGIVGIVNDITEIKKMNQKVDYLSNYDALTGLPNVNYLKSSLSELIKAYKLQNEKFAVLFISINELNLLYEILSLDAGDEFLKMASKRIKKCIRSEDLVSRVRWNEFAVVYKVDDKEKISNCCKNIIHEITKTWEYEGSKFHIASNIGIALYPDDGHNTDEIMNNGHIAMENTTINSKNTYLFYAREFSENIIERVKLENDLRNAVRNDELMLYYQPQVNTETKQVIGYEALIRWRHPEKGILYPGAFIFIAEETGLIIDIGKWVIRKACRQLKELGVNENNNKSISVNVSAKQFEDSNLVSVIKAAVRGNLIPPSSLHVEITESLLLKDRKMALQKLKDIKEIGVEIELDDFGTGYSSLLYLKDFPISKIKIDRNFIRDINSIDDEVIVKNIIDLSKQLGLKTIAEGVETEEQYNMLKKMGCDEIQGFLFGWPADTID